MRPSFPAFPASPASRSTRPRCPNLWLVIATAGFLSSCAPDSVHPLATPADTSLDERLRGAWMIANFPQDSVQYSRVDVGSAQGSIMVVRDSLFYEELALRFVHLGGRWFVDAQPESLKYYRPDDEDPARIRREKKQHFLMRLEIRSDTIEAHGFEGGNLGEFRRQHPGELALKEKSSYYTTSYTLTDRTPELRRFVARIADVDSMFGDGGLVFVRPH